MRIMITTSLISVVSVLSVLSAPLSDAVQGYKQDLFLNGNSTYILLTGIDDAVRGCRKDSDGNTVCPQDLGLVLFIPNS